MTNSIVATEQELKELLEKGFFVWSEPVKKGEVLGQTNIGSSKNKLFIQLHNGKDNPYLAIEDNVYSVKNKKGEKQWYCPECKQLSPDGFYLLHEHGCKLCKADDWKPLLVRLDKIEKETRPYLDCGKWINNYYWLETFRRVEE